jgi:hypothetical protein
MQRLTDERVAAFQSADRLAEGSTDRLGCVLRRIVWEIALARVAGRSRTTVCSSNHRPECIGYRAEEAATPDLVSSVRQSRSGRRES